ncbi:MAG TPA: RidA family protein [Gemmatimonadales bacterium]
MTIRTVSTREAPEPAGHYSQAVVEGGFVFVAGQLPIDPATGAIAGGPDDIAAQTRQVLRNVDAILRAAGSGLERLVSVTVFVTSRSQWKAVDQAYAEMLGAHRPARAVIPVPELRPGCLIEVQAIASAGPA